MEGKVIGTQAGHPPMAHGVQLCGAQDVGERVIICINIKSCSIQILMEPVGDSPLKSQELELVCIVVLL